MPDRNGRVEGRKRLVSFVYNHYIRAMSNSAVISARVDADTLALVDRVSKAHGRSRAWFAARAIQKMAEREAEFLAFVQEGIDSADRKELIPHEEVLDRLERKIAKHRARCED